MVYAIVRHTVRDYDTWLPFFGADDARRRAAGSTGHNQIYRDADNPNTLTIVLEWDSAERALKFMNDPALGEVMGRAGVDQPTVQTIASRENPMSAENEVREASKRNRDAMKALVNGDASQLAEVWSQSATLTTLHPTGGGDVGGWEAVKGAYENFNGIATDGSWELKDQHVQVLGDVAYETGTEHVSGKLGGQPYHFASRVTNIYQREAGGWKMVHHHAETSPAMLEVLKQLQP